MRRSRTIAGTPLRSAAEAWDCVLQLIENSLERSAEVPDGSCRPALQGLAGVMPLVIATGVYGAAPMIVAAKSFQVAITIPTGDDAFDVDEDLGPVLGGASASLDWKLHVPGGGSLGNLIEAAVAAMPHATTSKAPDPGAATKSTAASSGLNQEFLRGLGGR